MIKVKALGTIERTLGNSLFTFNKVSMSLCEVINVLYNLDVNNTNFSTILNDIIIAINGVALSNGIGDLILESGDEVSLIPVSHGG